MNFEIVGEIEQIETIATGRRVKVRALLQKVHGRGRWRKRKGVASVRLPSGVIRRVGIWTSHEAFHQAIRVVPGKYRE